jgi:hypothetical protein
MLQLGDPTAVQQQDRLTIIGFPGNGDLNNDPTGLLTLSINQIYVSAVKPNNGTVVIQVGGNVEHGDSGGPALNANGQAVGVVSFGLADSGGGETSFLQTSGTARQLLRQAGINDYAANIPGHWHQSMRELQQLVNQYPRFKAANPFLQYATGQARSEVQTQETGSPASSTPATGSDGLSPLPFLIGGLIVLLFLFGGLALSRRHKPAAVPPAAGYGFPATGYPGLPPQPYGGSLPRPGSGQPVMIPQTPAYPGQPASPSFAPQPFYQPQPVPTQFQQPGNMPGMPVQRPLNGQAVFGAPPVTPNAGLANSDATIQARPQAGSQWRTWSCGHSNSNDALFCGICGEPASAPLVRRMEQ